MSKAPKEEQALTVSRDEQMMTLHKLGGSLQGTAPAIPMLRLEHTTDNQGEPNPLKGHYTIARRNPLGEWDKIDLGETIELHFLVQRHYCLLVKGNDKYSSSEFDDPMQSIKLFKRSGETSSLFGED